MSEGRAPCRERVECDCWVKALRRAIGFCGGIDPGGIDDCQVYQTRQDRLEWLSMSDGTGLADAVPAQERRALTLLRLVCTRLHIAHDTHWGWPEPSPQYEEEPNVPHVEVVHRSDQVGHP